MSATVRIELTPQAIALLAAAPRWPVAVTRAIESGLDYENQLTIGHAQRLKLSKRGPTTLGVVTNRLRSSLHATPAVTTAGTVSSTISSDVVYAAVHEFGFVGTVQVRAHARRINTYAGGSKTVATLRKDGRIVRRPANVVASSSVTVRAHPRRMNVPARSFLRSSLVERAPDYGRTLSRRIVAALRGPPS